MFLDPVLNRWDDIVDSEAWQTIGDGFSSVFRGIWGAITWIASTLAQIVKSTAQFLTRHWGLTSAIILGLIAAVVFTAALIFFWPGLIPLLAGLTISLPLFGAVAPLGFLGSMNIIGACILVGLSAFPATLVLSGLVHLGHAIYNGFDRLFTPAEIRYERLHNEMANMVENRQSKFTQEEQINEFIKENWRMKGLLANPTARPGEVDYNMVNPHQARAAVRFGRNHIPRVGMFNEMGKPPFDVPTDEEMEEARQLAAASAA